MISEEFHQALRKTITSKAYLESYYERYIPKYHLVCSGRFPPPILSLKQIRIDELIKADPWAIEIGESSRNLGKFDIEIETEYDEERFYVI
jgi:hypothetical protein